LSIATSIVGSPHCHGVYSVAVDIVIADAIVIAADIGIVGDIESLLSWLLLLSVFSYRTMKTASGAE
jgi:hypothetical protein